VRIHIVGASGSGTTTLGRALATQLELIHLDSDDFFWAHTEPPFQSARPPGERRAALAGELRGRESWVLSGSLCGWGDFLIPRFQLVVFLLVPAEVRLDRLRARELSRFGASALSPGGEMHETHHDFLEWAAAYDSGDTSMRSLARHEEWLAQVDCPVLRLENETSIGQQVERVLTAVGPAAAAGDDPR